MSETTIITDHKWKRFKYRNEVPEKVLSSDFDYQDPEDVIDGFFKYRKNWYHLDGFMILGVNHPFPNGYHGYMNDSFFSGVLIELSNDGEEYRVATFIS